jgi:hypothetical protein
MNHSPKRLNRRCFTGSYLLSRNTFASFFSTFFCGLFPPCRSVLNHPRPRFLMFLAGRKMDVPLAANLWGEAEMSYATAGLVSLFWTLAWWHTPSQLPGTETLTLVPPTAT